MPKLKCISVRQPWANLIIRGKKRIENRSWYTHYRGPLGIHASLNGTDLQELIDAEAQACCLPYAIATIPRGCVIGVARLVDCCRYRQLSPDLKREGSADKDPDNWCWVLTRPRRLLRPKAAKGQVGRLPIPLEAGAGLFTLLAETVH